MALGATIRRLRRERDLNINDLAKLVGAKDPSYIGKIERGKIPNLSSELVAGIARALDVSIDYLYMEAGWLSAQYDPGKLDLGEQGLIAAIRSIPTPSVRQLLLEQFTWIAKTARDADLARQPAESPPEYGEEKNP